MKRCTFVLLLVLFCATAFAQNKSEHTFKVRSNETRAVLLARTVLQAINEPRFTSCGFYIFVHEDSSKWGEYAQIHYIGKRCTLYFFKPFFDVLSDEQFKETFLHELGHVYYGDVNGYLLGAQIRADSFALRHLRKCGIDPSAYVPFLEKLYVMAQKDKNDRRIARAKQFVQNERKGLISP